ncbi:hypothetical protein SISNIDRAFT_470538 [Sistotremastrum niveocremeum HHB9708]|uniref:Protein CPL1-like domain-containing protein n=1 Tax=Sistotremastrum niveocremeum HHB9708 TaxID=1314777 RepID=A0A164NPX5_9AGAM|nr:hypothetical protein SISNIDRAFT_470538 [Sistotremastrum niveocremeum HHB9708]
MSSHSSFNKLIIRACAISIILNGVSAVNNCQPGTYLSNNVCRSADPGNYAPNAAMTTQYPCPKGTFQSKSGAASCCPCCVGWYNPDTEQTHCQQCANVANPANQNQMLQHGVSPAEATAEAQCSYATSPTPQSSCSNTSPSECPAAGGPYASFGMTKRSLSPMKCKRRGYQACSVMTGRGGFECVDVMNDLESCGGCIGNPLTNPGSRLGVDCSALPGVNDVRCVQGKCVISSCSDGFQLSDKGTCESRESGPHRAQYMGHHRKRHHAKKAVGGHDL